MKIPSIKMLGVVAAFAVVGTFLLISSFADSVTTINEGFESSANNFQVVSGGSWAVSNGMYQLTNPANPTSVQQGNANISVYKDAVSGDFNLSTDASTTATASAWNDFSIIFNYQDPNNYYFVSFNESTDDFTNGIFKVVNSQQTRLAQFSSNIIAGTAYSINIARQGDNYTVSQNGIKLAAVGDNGSAGGKVGFGSRNDGVTFDNLLVNVPDTNAPAAPVGLVADSVSGNSVLLSWSPSTDNVAATGYKVYRNGVYVGASASTSYTDSGLAAATNYAYTVYAYDASGNISLPSQALATKTAAVTSGTPLAKVDPTLIFNGNFETGSLSQWNSNQSCPDGVAVVPSPLKAGKYSAKFTVDDGDVTTKCPAVPNTGNPRAQLVSKPLFKNGSDVYVGFSVFLPAGFPANIPTSAALQISELYGAPFGGGPTVGTYIVSNRLALQISYQNSSGGLNYYKPWVSSVANPIGTAWQDLTLHVKFSPDKSVGFVEVWYNGTKQTLTDVNGTKTQKMYMATLVKGVNWDGNAGTNSLYLNSYRKKGFVPGTITFYQDEAKVGPTYQSVQP